MALLDDVLAASRCSIELPAGTGKTETIARLTADASAGGLRVLVLTHTHAGVDALRRRFKKLGVPGSSYVVRTIDSWCFDLIGHFPILSDIQVGDEPNWSVSADYHRAGARAVSSGAIAKMLKVSYGLLIVDEYQDCQTWQHGLIIEMAQNLPTLVLGDRMQGLFFFGNAAPVLWERDVLPNFVDLPTDVLPWRWRGKNEPLGEWLVDARRKLLGGHALNLNGAPIRVVSSAELIPAARDLPGHPERSVIMRRWPSDCAVLSARLGAGFTMMEELEGRHLLAFADQVDTGGAELANAVVEYAVSCAFGVATIFGAEQRRPLRALTPTRLDPSNFPGYHDQVVHINRLLEDQSREVVLAALGSLRRLPNFRPHRREAWLGTLDAVRLACASPDLTVRDCVVASRNNLRIRGRFPESRVIARPLLIKGLEFDHAVLAETAGLNAHELYVCLTRGSNTLTVATDSPTLHANRPTSID
jgi:hypothetical protein